MRRWNARKGPRMGPKVHEVDSARRTNKARACSMSVCCERGAQTKVDEEVSPNPAEFAQRSHKQ